MFMKWWMENSLAKKHPKRTNLILHKVPVRVLAIFMAFIVLTGCALLPNEMVEEEIPVITPPRLAEKPTYDVTTETIETRVRGSGKVMSMKEETLFFMSDAGRIKQIHVETGQQVVEGQLIAELDVTQLENDLRQQRLQFRSDELNMKQLLRRADEMSEEEFEQAKINFELKRTALVELEEKIQRARLTAPFDGTIVSIQAKPGDNMQAYQTVAVLADVSRLTVAINMSRDNLRNIAVGMEATVDINAHGSHQGTVLRLPVDTNQQNDPYNPYNPYPGNQQIDSPDKYLLIELDSFPEAVTRDTPLSAAVVIERKENAIVIPPSTLRTYGGRTYVQIVEEGGTKREVDIEVGQQTATQVEVLKGLEPGMKVVGR